MPMTYCSSVSSYCFLTASLLSIGAGNLCLIGKIMIAVYILPLYADWNIISDNADVDRVSVRHFQVSENCIEFSNQRPSIILHLAAEKHIPIEKIEND